MPINNQSYNYQFRNKCGLEWQRSRWHEQLGEKGRVSARRELDEPIKF
jgi:hypothetical protein